MVATCQQYAMGMECAANNGSCLDSHNQPPSVLYHTLSNMEGLDTVVLLVLTWLVLVVTKATFVKFCYRDLIYCKIIYYFFFQITFIFDSGRHS